MKRERELRQNGMRLLRSGHEKTQGMAERLSVVAGRSDHFASWHASVHRQNATGELFYPLPGAEKFLPHMQAILVDLSAIEEKQLPRDPDSPELHVVLLIMKTIFSKSKTELKRKFRVILDELKPYSQDRKYRELIRKLWYYVAYNAEKLNESDAEEIETDIRQTIGDDHMPTLAQIFIDKGKVESKTEAVLTVLNARFDKVPQTIHDAVVATTDIAQLDRMTVLAAKCKSLDEFVKAME